ncbi:MAG: YbaB/EbfC family nucleoid-associated protein [Patescibacteria group bacterium]
MFNKLKEVKDLRDQAKSLQNKLAEETVSVEHKGCSLKMDGNQKILSLTIADNLLSKDNKSKLESILIELHAQALKKVQKVMMQKMREQGDFNLPGLS